MPRAVNLEQLIEAERAMGRRCEEMNGRCCPEDRSCEETITALRRRISELEAALIEAPWQPIETCPTDKTLVIAGHPNHGIALLAGNVARYGQFGGPPYWSYTLWTPAPALPKGGLDTLLSGEAPHDTAGEER